MPGKHRTYAPKDGPRKCAVCKLAISETRPVYLVASVAGRITGPFHASCAGWLTEQEKQGKLKAGDVGSAYGRIILPGREETLTW